MAIYHLSVKTVSRSKGRSATAAAAYRASQKIEDQRTGEVHDYRRKKGLMWAQIVLPDNLNLGRAELWNMAEKAENRRNSTVAREYVIALPTELTGQQQQALSREFAEYLVKTYKVGADICIHEPGKEGDQRNVHAHILTTTRELSPEGLGKKTRVLDQRNTGEIKKIRKTWAIMTNQALARAGSKAQVDHRSYKDQGKKEEPQIHLGPACTAIKRKAKRKGLDLAQNERLERFYEIQAMNDMVIQEQMLREQIQAEMEALTEDAMRQAQAWIDERIDSWDFTEMDDEQKMGLRKGLHSAFYDNFRNELNERQREDLHNYIDDAWEDQLLQAETEQQLEEQEAEMEAMVEDQREHGPRM